MCDANPRIMSQNPSARSHIHRNSFSCPRAFVWAFAVWLCFHSITSRFSCHNPKKQGSWILQDPSLDEKIRWWIRGRDFESDSLVNTSGNYEIAQNMKLPSKNVHSVSYHPLRKRYNLPRHRPCFKGLWSKFLRRMYLFVASAKTGRNTLRLSEPRPRVWRGGGKHFRMGNQTLPKKQTLRFWGSDNFRRNIQFGAVNIRETTRHPKRGSASFVPLHRTASPGKFWADAIFMHSNQLLSDIKRKS